MKPLRSVLASVLVGALAVSAAACGAVGGQADVPVKLGASLQLTGVMSLAGTEQRDGLELAVSDINDAGGVAIGGVRRRLELKIVDNASEPETAQQQARDLVVKDDVDVLLGSCLPDFNVPIGLVAEEHQVPLVSTCVPLNVWETARENGWQWAWNMYFREERQGQLLVDALADKRTNKKVALFTDISADGIAQRKLFRRVLREKGFQIVRDHTFPPGTTDYRRFIRSAKAADADILLSVVIFTDGAALWKQVKELDWKPKIAIAQKGGQAGNWPDLAGDAAEGSISTAVWAEDSRGPGSDNVLAAFGGAVPMPNIGMHAVNYAVVQVVKAALERAGSTEPERLKTALDEIDVDVAVGHVKFSAKRTAEIPTYVLQWQGKHAMKVFPEPADMSMAVPAKGFA